MTNKFSSENNSLQILSQKRASRENIEHEKSGLLKEKDI